MDTVKQKLDSTKKFVVNHRGKLVFVATAAGCLALNRLALKDHNEFLKEHGLYDAFYTPTDEEMGE